MYSEQETYAEMVAAEREAAMNELLQQWHQWQSRFSVGIGYRNRSSTFSSYVPGKEYDDVHGVHDEYLLQHTMESIDFQVSEMQEPYRTAIFALARALDSGTAVWSHPRLPENREERIAVVAAARNILTARLISAGVL